MRLKQTQKHLREESLKMRGKQKQAFCFLKFRLFHMCHGKVTREGAEAE